MTSNSSSAALTLEQITVQYGSVKALSEISVSFEAGQIHAVVGQNGAGKTTFARVAAGIVKPVTGQIAIGGKPLPTGDVTRARRAGVELVHQSFALPPSFSVAEAMEFGANRPGRIFSKRQLKQRWMSHLAGLDLDIDPHRKIRDLPVETRQGVEIARAMVSDANLLILDEPTAVLSPAGIDLLFARVRRLKGMGVTVIVILHKIREVLGVADTVTVLRGGRHVAGPVDCSELDPGALGQLIIGDAPVATDQSDLSALIGAGETQPARASDTAAIVPDQTPLLSLRNVSTRPDPDGPALDRFDLDLRPGEILGVAGVDGNGQSTLVRAIAGLAEVASGSVFMNGVDMTRRNLNHRRAAGLRIVPFERNTEGLSLTSSLWENWSAGSLLQGALLKYVRPGQTQRDCDRALREWDVRYHSASQPAGSLSGGNAQKVILAREFDAGARMIIAAQPTRGLDIGATSFVWQALRKARERGCAILLISSDLDELFDISDRVIVMLSGACSGNFAPPYDARNVGNAMSGATLTEVLK